jgi:predicted Zn-dependent protease with MMP-like domain
VLAYSAVVSDLRRARFARLVRNALDELPAEFRDRLRNLEIVIEDEPPAEREPDGGTLLGLYEGVPLTQRGAQEPYLPDRICIFRGPIERISASPRRQASIVRDTVVHEIAHHFGISDARLGELGLGDAD